MNRHLVYKMIGVSGAATCVAAFVLDPSWPTPDKLLVFLTFLCMMFGQALAMLKRLGPFVAILLVYESLRGLVPSLNTHVHYLFMPGFDSALTGTGELPTLYLQQWLWHGHVAWYDFLFYGAYMLHFVLPLGLAVLVWKFHDSQYWRVAATYITVSFAGFITFLAYPAAPPWLAAQNGYIPHLTRVSGQVFAAMGIHNFPSLYNEISPNPVAAVPSLHSAYATLLVLLVWRNFGRRWGLLSCIYPLLIWFGTVYMGEHYVFDELLGIVYAMVSFAAVYAFADHVWPRVWLRAAKPAAVQ